jgi:hypothetical protein
MLPISKKINGSGYGFWAGRLDPLGAFIRMTIGMSTQIPTGHSFVMLGAQFVRS